MTKRQPAPHEEKLRAIYFAVGAAITQWQSIELGLTQLFVLLINAADGNAASAAFNSVLGFKIKLDMVDAAAHVRLVGSPLLAEWESMFNRLGKKAKKRNDIAHFMIIQGSEEIPGQSLPNFDFTLQPSFFDGAIRWRYDGKPPRLTTTDIMNRANAFVAAGNDVWAFTQKVTAHLARPQSSP